MLSVFGLCRDSILMCDIDRTILGGVGADFAQTTFFRGGLSIETIHSIAQLDGQYFELVESAELWTTRNDVECFDAHWTLSGLANTGSHSALVPDSGPFKPPLPFKLHSTPPLLKPLPLNPPLPPLNPGQNNIVRVHVWVFLCVCVFVCVCFFLCVWCVWWCVVVCVGWCVVW